MNLMRRHRRENGWLETDAWDAAISRVGFDGLPLDAALDARSNWWWKRKQFAFAYLLAAVIHLLLVIGSAIFWSLYAASLSQQPIGLLALLVDRSVFDSDATMLVGRTDTCECGDIPLYLTNTAASVINAAASVITNATVTALPSRITLNPTPICTYSAYEAFYNLVILLCAAAWAFFVASVYNVYRQRAIHCCDGGDEELLRAAFGQRHPDQVLPKQLFWVAQLLLARDKRRDRRRKTAESKSKFTDELENIVKRVKEGQKTSRQRQQQQQQQQQPHQPQPHQSSPQSSPAQASPLASTSQPTESKNDEAARVIRKNGVDYIIDDTTAMATPALMSPSPVPADSTNMQLNASSSGGGGPITAHRSPVNNGREADDPLADDNDVQQLASPSQMQQQQPAPTITANATDVELTQVQKKSPEADNQV